MATTAKWYDGIEVAKDPDAELDYQLDFSDWISTGDTISTASVDGGGLTVGTTSNDDDSVTFWLSGGTAGASYDVRVRVTTTGGRSDDRTVTFVVAER